jgi:hypothetical protein
MIGLQRPPVPAEGILGECSVPSRLPSLRSAATPALTAPAPSAALASMSERGGLDSDGLMDPRRALSGMGPAGQRPRPEITFAEIPRRCGSEVGSAPTRSTAVAGPPMFNVPCAR